MKATLKTTYFIFTRVKYKASAHHIHLLYTIILLIKIIVQCIILQNQTVNVGEEIAVLSMNGNAGEVIAMFYQ